MKNFTVISDPGIDDLIALVLLYKLGFKANNCLISTFGNATEEITAQNAQEFISFVSPNWQFMHGSLKPLNNKFEHSWPDYFHGPDGTWGIHPTADITKINALTAYPKNKDVISLATLTDVYKLHQAKSFNNIMIMGGAFTIKGNETQYAETNIAFDPDAAHNFFNQSSGIKVKVVPLDVTRKVFWTFKKVNKIPETNGINQWLKKLLLTWFDKYNHDKEEDFNLHDPLAVYLTWFPNEAVWITRGVEVIIKGEKRGQTILQNNNPVCKIALKLKDPSAVAETIFTKVFGL